MRLYIIYFYFLETIYNQKKKKSNAEIDKKIQLFKMLEPTDFIQHVHLKVADTKSRSGTRTEEFWLLHLFIILHGLI